MNTRSPVTQTTITSTIPLFVQNTMWIILIFIPQRSSSKASIWSNNLLSFLLETSARAHFRRRWALWACGGTHFSGGNSSQHTSLLVLITHNKQHRCFLIRWSQRGSHYQLWRKKEGERKWESFHKQKSGFLMHTEGGSTINRQ